MEETAEKYYLGFDFSTQQIKGVVINEDNVSFDKDLKEYRTQHGFHEGPKGKVTSPTIMWVTSFVPLVKIKMPWTDN